MAGAQGKSGAMDSPGQPEPEPEPQSGPEPRPEPGPGREAEREAAGDDEGDDRRAVTLGGDAGVLHVEEAYWSDDPRARGSGTGATLWEGSVLLARHLVRMHGGHGGGGTLRGRALELGCGCSAVPSLAAARLGCFSEVIATDGGDEAVEDNLVDLQRNIEANARPTDCCPIRVQRLEWGAAAAAGLSPPLDCLLASEVVYEAQCVPLLLDTLHALSSPSTLILLFVSERNQAASAAFWAAAPERFAVERVGPEPLDAEAPLAARQQGVFQLSRR